MKLLNTVDLPNGLVAHGLNHMAVYNAGVIKVYAKNSDTNTVKDTGVSYALSGVKVLAMSENGAYIVAQDGAKTYLCKEGIVGTPLNVVGKFSVTNSGMIVLANPTAGSVQLITDVTTNLTATLTAKDKVVCGRGKFVVYNETRSLVCGYQEVVLVSETHTKKLMFVSHVGLDEFAYFFDDGSIRCRGKTTTSLPMKYFRFMGNHVIGTVDGFDYSYIAKRPLTRVEKLRESNYTDSKGTAQSLSDLYKFLPNSRSSIFSGVLYVGNQTRVNDVITASAYRINRTYATSSGLTFSETSPANDTLIWFGMDNSAVTNDGPFIAIGCFRQTGSIAWQQRIKVPDAGTLSSGRATISGGSTPALYVVSGDKTRANLRVLKYDALTGANRLLKDFAVFGAAHADGMQASFPVTTYAGNLCTSACTYNTSSKVLRVSISVLDRQTLTPIRNYIVNFPFNIFQYTRGGTLSNATYKDKYILVMHGTLPGAVAQVYMHVFDHTLNQYKLRSIKLVGTTTVQVYSVIDLFVVDDLVIVSASVKTDGGTTEGYLVAIGDAGLSTEYVAWSKIVNFTLSGVFRIGNDVALDFSSQAAPRILIPVEDLANATFTAVGAGTSKITLRNNPNPVTLSSIGGYTLTGIPGGGTDVSVTVGTGTQYSLTPFTPAPTVIEEDVSFD